MQKRLRYKKINDRYVELMNELNKFVEKWNNYTNAPQTKNDRLGEIITTFETLSFPKIVKIEGDELHALKRHTAS